MYLMFSVPMLSVASSLGSPSWVVLIICRHIKKKRRVALGRQKRPAEAARGRGSDRLITNVLFHRFMLVACFARNLTQTVGQQS